MAIELGGEKAWKVRTKGDLVMSYQWLQGEPSLFIYRRSGRPRDAGALVVRLQDAHKWGDGATGSANLPYAMDMAQAALSVIGAFQSTHNAMAVIDAVISGLPDLIHMPPQPQWAEPERPVIGEMVAKRDGETILEREIH